MPRVSKPKNPAQLNLLEARTTTAPCVPAIRAAVDQWREQGYPGVTKTTKELLRWWFQTDHRIRGRTFRYHDCQRHAIETLIYLYEVRQVRRQKDLLETFAERSDLRLLQYDQFARYCIKMATGSGKTKVIALAIVWQYFNAVNEGRDDCARTFLLLAPNVIVYERLAADFTNGHIFHADPMIPPHLLGLWQFDCYLRGEPERAASEGALYVTNIDQLHADEQNEAAEPDPLSAVLGALPPAKKQEVEDFDERIAARRGHCMILNDEAHHTHDEESAWNKTIRRIHASLNPCGIMQVDVTATPRHQKGFLFSWTIYDFPLKQAILENLVKRPIKGVAKGMSEQHSDIASVKYQPYLVAGVERWREYCQQLAPFGKKPLLFVMMNDTREAEEVADFLRTKYPEHFDKESLLVIHTNRTGDVATGDLDAARKVAREADRDESKVKAIVSVLMLREGWDVKNVTVIVGLRPYTSKAAILPEQTIGRGLRLMFRNEGSNYTERVDIIGNPKFIEFVEALEREEDIELETFEVGKDPVTITHIQPDPLKAARDITLPELSPLLTRKKTLADEIAHLQIHFDPSHVLPIRAGDMAAQNFRYEGKDILTLQVEVEREYTIPEPQTAQEVISYYAKRIAEKVKLPSQFAALAPRVRDFLAETAFGKPVDLAEAHMVKAISTNVAMFVTVETFVKALRGLVIEEHTPELTGVGRPLLETTPYPFSKPTFVSDRTIFNLVAADNDFERRFAKFLSEAEGVEAFAKLPQRFGFAIDYTDNAGSLRYYEPDFVVRTEEGVHWLIETKGREDIDVKHKDRAALLWCENATNLTGIPWKYVKVPQEGFENLQPTHFTDLIVFARPSETLL